MADNKKTPSMKVKKGDTVLVLSGKDKGAKGRVIAAFPKVQTRAGRGRRTGSRSTPASAPPSAAPSRAASSRRRRPST